MEVDPSLKHIETRHNMQEKKDQRLQRSTLIYKVKSQFNYSKFYSAKKENSKFQRLSKLTHKGDECFCFFTPHK